MAASGATSRPRPTERPVAVFWSDASPLTNAPYGQRGGGRQGTPAKGPTPAKRQSATLCGALPLRTQRCAWQRAERGTCKTFLAFLHQLHQRFAEALLLVLLDKAKRHPSRALKHCLEQHTWVALQHLEPYAPEDNPIERCGRGLKAKGYGATACDTMEDVLRKSRQLIWHDNEGGLTSTIHFDFTLYQEIL